MTADPPMHLSSFFLSNLLFFFFFKKKKLEPRGGSMGIIYAFFFLQAQLSMSFVAANATLW
jgi:hypothetical protein